MVSTRAVDAKAFYELYRRRRRNPYIERPLPTPDEDTARWVEYCATIEDRILEVRAEQTDPICRACGSSTPDIRQEKWCSGCVQYRPVALFAINRSRYDGRQGYCRTCSATRVKEWRTRVAIAGRTA